ncbi:unannotated protein [freshwater metagenome]|uniref:Unannotated protein n=1 Tax=freshwater metagenome TaxID=449393 RepID=A0A6J7QTG5_9ZZZZ
MNEPETIRALAEAMKALLDTSRATGENFKGFGIDG